MKEELDKTENRKLANQKIYSFQPNLEKTKKNSTQRRTVQEFVNEMYNWKRD